MIESHSRSIVKAISWRLIASTVTGLIVLSVTGRLDFAGGAGLIDLVLKFAMYYGHERLWDRIPYGRLHEPEFEI